jgi:hypothetical protein
MSRIQALLAAGALTGLVIVALFWYGTSDAATTITTPPASITAPNETATPDMQFLLEQNQQLRETVTTLLNREAGYRQQIEAANQQLLAAQGQPATTQSATGWFSQDDGDEHDAHEEHEYGGHDQDD